MRFEAAVKLLSPQQPMLVDQCLTGRASELPCTIGRGSVLGIVSLLTYSWFRMKAFHFTHPPVMPLVVSNLRHVKHGNYSGASF